RSPRPRVHPARGPTPPFPTGPPPHRRRRPVRRTVRRQHPVRAAGDGLLRAAESLAGPSLLVAGRGGAVLPAVAAAAHRRGPGAAPASRHDGRDRPGPRWLVPALIPAHADVRAVGLLLVGDPGLAALRGRSPGGRGARR